MTPKLKISKEKIFVLKTKNFFTEPENFIFINKKYVTKTYILKH